MVARFWKWNDEFGDIERQLRAQRSLPREELVDQVAQGLSAKRGVLVQTRRRLVYSSAVTAVTLVGFAALGGVGHATSKTMQLVGISQTASTSPAQKNSAAKGDQGSGHASTASKSSQNQYEEKVTICHRPRGKPSNGQTLRLPPTVAQQHLSNHPGDTPGPCMAAAKAKAVAAAAKVAGSTSVRGPALPPVNPVGFTG